jgi:membrane-bound lytic murein transglycosylase D
MLGSLLAALCTLARAADDPMPRPAALERDVQFWIRVYTEINTNSGFVHDENNLAVVYETLNFGSNSTPRERERAVESARDRYVAALRRIAFANGPLSAEDQRVRALWGDEATPIRLLEATNHIRFQLGQSDRFRSGLIRSGQWETHIAETLANLGLPAELAVLPHVESSFNAAAYSKAGAAGLWQFIRSTGRRYLRIDASVDDRLDPFRSTEAAAQLLSYNYRLLGTWPLALTAYNHGPAGVRRAKETLGTDDIVQIVRNYKSPSFGFASRNYYASFLAALDVDHNPEKYFGPIAHAPELKFQELVMPGRVSIGSLEHAIGVNREELRELNPALRPACWRGLRPIPSGYRLRLPLDGNKWTAELLARRLGIAPGDVLASASEAAKHRVLPGETLASIAAQYGVSESRLASLNGLRSGARVRIGSAVRVPEGQPGLIAAVTRSDSAAPRLPAKIATAPAASPPQTVASAAPLVASAPVADAAQSESVASTAAPASPPADALPGITTTFVEENSVAENVESAAPATAAAEAGVYIVQRGESLADIASRVGISESKLLEINHIPNPNYIFEGQRLQLETIEIAANAPGSPSAGAADAATPDGSAAADGVPASVAERESEEDAAAVASVAKPAEGAEPVSAAQAEALGPALGPAAGETSETPDPTDYSVGKEGMIVVAASETLGHYADWLHVGATRLRNLNHMRYGRPVLMGHKVKLDFSRVSREDFEAKRRDYHRTLEAEYFAAHRITGTEVYIARRGDSLWNVTQRYEHLPVWLLQQYNPDVDLSELRAGTEIVVPKVEDVAAGGG